MSFKTWRTRELLGAFFVWVTQPRILGIIGICMGLGIITWNFMDEPIFGYTIRAFITKTLPLWIESLIAYTAQAAARRPIARFFYKVLSIIAIQTIVEWLRRHFEEELTWWQELVWWKKLLCFVAFVAILWLLIGWWALMLFPVFAARDMLITVFRWGIHTWGLSPFFERIEARIYAAIPAPIRETYNRFDHFVRVWAEKHREKLHNHHRVRALQANARHRLYLKKQRKEAERRKLYTEAFREKFRSPPFF